jgi:beta-glucosidase
MTNSAGDLPIYKNSLLPISQRVDDLLSCMSPAQKLAQLNCTALRFMEAERSEAVMGQGMGHFALSIVSGETIEQNAALVEAAQRFLIEQTELGIPAIVHVEALSGAMLVGATNFHGALGLGATWNPEGVEAMGRVIAKQLVSLGIRHVLSPVMDVARDLRWGRIGETYGEDATLVARMSVAFVKGVQSDDINSGVATTGKHFLGYAATEGGLNMTAEQIGPRELREVYAKPFAAAIHEARLAAIMNSYSTLDGVPIVAAPEILTELLRGELGFTGMTISDYGAINKLAVPLQIADDYIKAGIQALQAGLDVKAPEIVAYGPGLLNVVEMGWLPIEILDRAVRWVLELKFRLGLFEHPYPDRETITRAFAQPEDDALSYRLAQEAIVLLKNKERMLPLSTELRNIAVIGPNAHLLRTLFGGYSYPAALEVNSDILASREGAEHDFDVPGAVATHMKNGAWLESRLARLYPQAVTVRDAIAAKLPTATVAYAQGCGLKGSDHCIVSNTGTRAGDEVVQLYIADRLASVARSVKELAGFRRIHLAAGQSRRVRFTMQFSQLAFLDPKMRWVVEPGEMDLLVGASSQDIRLEGSFTIRGETVEVGAERAFYASSSDEVLDGYVPSSDATSQAHRRFSLDTTIGDLLANEASRAVLERHIPNISAHPMGAMLRSLTMRQLGAMPGAAIEPKVVRAIAADLAALED